MVIDSIALLKALMWAILMTFTLVGPPLLVDFLDNKKKANKLEKDSKKKSVNYDLLKINKEG